MHLSLEISESAYAHSCFPLGLWTMAKSRQCSVSHTDVIFLHLFQEISLPCHLIKGLVFKLLQFDSAWFGDVATDHVHRQLSSQSWGAQNMVLEGGIGGMGRLEAVTSFSGTGSTRAYVSIAYGQQFSVRNTRNLWSLYYPISLLTSESHFSI